MRRGLLLRAPVLLGLTCRGVRMSENSTTPSGLNACQGWRVISTDRSTFSLRSLKLGCFLTRSWYTCTAQMWPQGTDMQLPLAAERAQCVREPFAQRCAHLHVTTSLTHHPDGRALHSLATQGLQHERVLGAGGWGLDGCLGGLGLRLHLDLTVGDLGRTGARKNISSRGSKLYNDGCGGCQCIPAHSSRAQAGKRPS